MAPETKPQQLDEISAKLLTPHLKGVNSVTLRMVGPDPRLEAALMSFIQARGILVDVTRLERIVPQPLRRYSFQYTGRTAVLTVSPEAELKG